MKNFLVALISLFSVSAVAGPHVVFVIGEKEYKTEESLTEFFESELKPAGYTATFFTAPPEGDKRNDFSGLAEALEKADVVMVSTRRRAPAAADMAALKKFVADGKPLMGIRTASHAFHLKDKPIPEGHAVWEEFDPEILGGNYTGHYRDEPAPVMVVKGSEKHSILVGVGKLPATTKLYNSDPLKSTATGLLIATVEGKKPEPVAWTNEVGENKAKVFYTSLGLVEEFEDTEFRKLLKNAFAWAVAK
ncbi:ThuA domain-containing protein [Verrucomicrobiales bacterium]|nr:ThuA domain-containing protein [Verrucomicrobiales bacterium]